MVKKEGVKKNNVLFKNCDYKELLKIIKKLDIKIDTIIADPPYGVSRKNQLGFSNMGRSGMNYGEWDYDFNQREWIRLCAPFVKNGGSMIIFNDWKNFSYIVEELDKQGFLMKDVIRWVKPNPMPRNITRRYVGDFELAIWAVKAGGKWTFNKPKVVPYLKPLYESPSIGGGEKRLHPTQKPLKIMEELIRTHTNKGDVILDPFSGSGTTAVGCIKNKRLFIGSEISKTYYDKAMERIKCFTPQ